MSPPAMRQAWTRPAQSYLAVRRPIRYSRPSRRVAWSTRASSAARSVRWRRAISWVSVRRLRTISARAKAARRARAGTVCPGVYFNPASSIGTDANVPSAAMLTVTVVNQSGAGNLVVWSGVPATAPMTSALNYGTFATVGAVANTTVVPFNVGRATTAADFAVFVNAATNADVVVDVVGYFTPPVATAVTCNSPVELGDRRHRWGSATTPSLPSRVQRRLCADRRLLLRRCGRERLHRRNRRFRLRVSQSRRDDIPGHVGAPLLPDGWAMKLSHPSDHPVLAPVARAAAGAPRPRCRAPAAWP